MGRFAEVNGVMTALSASLGAASVPGGGIGVVLTRWGPTADSIEFDKRFTAAVTGEPKKLPRGVIITPAQPFNSSRPHAVGWVQDEWTFEFWAYTEGQDTDAGYRLSLERGLAVADHLDAKWDLSAYGPTTSYVGPAQVQTHDYSFVMGNGLWMTVIRNSYRYTRQVTFE